MAEVSRKIISCGLSHSKFQPVPRHVSRIQEPTVLASICPMPLTRTAQFGCVSLVWKVAVLLRSARAQVKIWSAFPQMLDVAICGRGPRQTVLEAASWATTHYAPHNGSF